MSVPRGCDTGAQAPIPPALPPTEAAALVCRSLEFRLLRDQSARRLANLFARFGVFVERGYGCGTLAEVTPDHVRAFVDAPLEGETLSSPSIATRHLRRSGVRLMFRLARRTGLVDGDPTADTQLPPRSSLRQRPLTDDEVLLCRSFSLQTLTETRQPAAWALAETSARTGEIPAIRVSDLDLEAGSVFIAGTHRTEPRQGYLTEWGRIQLERRLRALGDLSADPLLVYAGRGTDESAQASSCAAIAAILTRAGLSGEPDVGPASVAAWVGAEAHSRGLPIEQVAQILGVQSLDRAARLIGWDWREQGS